LKAGLITEKVWRRTRDAAKVFLDEDLDKRLHRAPLESIVILRAIQQRRPARSGPSTLDTADNLRR